MQSRLCETEAWPGQPRRVCVCQVCRQAPHARRELLQVSVLVVLTKAVELLRPLDCLVADATIVLGLPSLLGLSFVGLADRGGWVGAAS